MRRLQKWKKGKKRGIKTKPSQWLVSWGKRGQSPVINLTCSSPGGLWMKIFDVTYCSLLFYLSWGQEVTVRVKRSVRQSHFQSSPEWCQAFLSWTKVYTPGWWQMNKSNHWFLQITTSTPTNKTQTYSTQVHECKRFQLQKLNFTHRCVLKGVRTEFITRLLAFSALPQGPV